MCCLGGILKLFVDSYNGDLYSGLVSVALIIVTIIGLALVLVVNEVINNAARTVFQGSGQPSEVAKITLVIYLSVWLFARRDQLSSVSFGLIPLSIILGILGGLILLQPDLSATATIFLLGGIMFFLAGGDIRQIVLFLLIGIVVGWLLRTEINSDCTTNLTIRFTITPNKFRDSDSPGLVPQGFFSLVP